MNTHMSLYVHRIGPNSIEVCCGDKGRQCLEEMLDGVSVMREMLHLCLLLLTLDNGPQISFPFCLDASLERAFAWTTLEKLWFVSERRPVAVLRGCR